MCKFKVFLKTVPPVAPSVIPPVAPVVPPTDPFKDLLAKLLIEWIKSLITKGILPAGFTL